MVQLQHKIYFTNVFLCLIRRQWSWLSSMEVRRSGLVIRRKQQRKSCVRKKIPASNRNHGNDASWINNSFTDKTSSANITSAVNKTKLPLDGETGFHKPTPDKQASFLCHALLVKKTVFVVFGEISNE